MNCSISLIVDLQPKILVKLIQIDLKIKIIVEMRGLSEDMLERAIDHLKDDQ